MGTGVSPQLLPPENLYWSTLRYALRDPKILGALFYLHRWVQNIGL
jgi:hypothetical protein